MILRYGEIVFQNFRALTSILTAHLVGDQNGENNTIYIYDFIISSIYRKLRIKHGDVMEYNRFYFTSSVQVSPQSDKNVRRYGQL